MSLIYKAITIFLSSMLGGLMIFLNKKIKKEVFDYTLIFSGSFLFGITILHILPDLFRNYNLKIGIGIIMGFLLQRILELFSGGIEHGHIYPNSCEKGNKISKNTIPILMSLCIHGFMDSILIHDSCNNHHCNDLLIGIVLHKAPAAFALTSILKNSYKSNKTILIYLLIFSLSSPFGIYLSKILDNLFVYSDNFAILAAIAGGSFLHISTTIFYESTPHHSTNFRYVTLSVIGLFVAILSVVIHS